METKLVVQIMQDGGHVLALAVAYFPPGWKGVG